MRLGLGISIPGTSGLVQAAFSPLDLSPVLWLDAADTSTITESGGAVSQWDDLSGNGNNFVQATAADQPTTGATTFNSLNVIDFAADFMSGTVTFVQTTGWVFIVASWSAAVRNALYGGPSSVNDPGLYQSGSGSTGWTAIPATATTYTVGSSSTGDLLSAQHGSTSGLRKNGVALAESGGPQAAIDTDDLTTLGARGALRLTGFIAEVIVVDGTLTAGEISDTETYLANKWGITL